MSTTTFSAAGAITIKRLRNGDTLYLTLGTDNPLFQAVNPTTGAVAPDWTVEANRPKITPKCYTAKNGEKYVTLSGHEWTWNNIKLDFPTEASEGGLVPCSNADGSFAIGSDGSLTIIKNLASKENSANDTITYSATATVDGVEYAVTKSVDVVIHTAGDTTYSAYITADPAILTSEDPSTTLKLWLWNGTVPESADDYYVRWLRGIEGGELTAGKKKPTLPVNRNLVDGTTVFIAEVYGKEVSSIAAGDTPLCRASIRITDLLDEYQIRFRYLANSKGVMNTAVEPGNGVKVQAFVWNVTQGKEVPSESASWKIDVQSPEDGTSRLKDGALAQDYIEVTTEHTDTAAGQMDVIVVAEAEWS